MQTYWDAHALYVFDTYKHWVIVQELVAQRMDSAIHQKNPYQANKIQTKIRVDNFIW